MRSTSCWAWSFERPSRAISKNLPWRTSLTPLYPILVRAEWMVLPCGSSTVRFKETNTCAFMVVFGDYMSAHTAFLLHLGEGRSVAAGLVGHAIDVLLRDRGGEGF